VIRKKSAQNSGTLLEQNEDPDSEFFGKVSARAGVSGHSQGGAGADRASTHPNVVAIVNVQGSFGSPPPNRGAAFLCLTGTEDIATEGCRSAVNASSSPALFASYDGMGHVDTLLATSPGTVQYMRLFTAWFRCFLADDIPACKMFQGGANCSICSEDEWDEIFASNY
jgi:hypothetical protein